MMMLAKQLSEYDNLTVHCNSSGERRAGAIGTQCSTRDDEIHHDQSVQFAGQHASFELCVDEMCRRVKKADISLNNEFLAKRILSHVKNQDISAQLLHNNKDPRKWQ